MARTFIITVALILTGCAASPYDFPMPTVLPDGGRGFSMNGIVQFTPDEGEAKQEITNRFRNACRGPVEVRHLEMNGYKGPLNSGFYYNAVAACR
ncbi:hypothetical protein [Azospirillum sp.]|uniref:hypothetical protein n=1 Tax=Azospirillum sp. TaxID=34012 RepID=UPI002D5C9F93|nr:hypothetical protein [Azospirillum sp.]HYD69286.1 hypothetical protein [Azospirillum sp.]